MESREERIQKQAQMQLYRKLNSIDGMCFKQCVKGVEKRLTEEQEKCLKICFNKTLTCLDHIHRINEQQIQS